jgi:hypothetical protein
MSSDKTKRRHDLTVREKFNLLEKYDELPKTSQTQAANKLGISQPLLCKILKQRYDIETSILNNETVTRKRKRCGKDEAVEKALKEWFERVREKDARIDGPVLKTKAENLAKMMGKENFHATSGWFTRWQKRENIVYGKPQGETGDADSVAAESWIRDVWPDIISDYPPDCIYNADETGLYYRALPEHTYIFKNEKSKGVKTCKERITVLCCVSMSGEKKELLVIGKSKKPRCFKGVKKLPVRYCNNANAWMTSSIFTDWVREWDRCLNHKIVLLIDNCPGHPKEVNLKNIRIIFLPANTTSLMQPCDQGVIRTLKAYYRHEMRTKIVRWIDAELEKGEEGFQANDLAKQTSLLDAVHLLATAWNFVTDATIRNCFRKGGFASIHVHEDIEEQPLPPKASDLSEKEYADWMAIDDEVPCSAPTTEEELCLQIMNETNDVESDEEDEPDQLPTPPSHTEMLKALDTLGRGFQFYGENFNMHYSYVVGVHQMLEHTKKQTKIVSFFQPRNE